MEIQYLSYESPTKESEELLEAKQSVEMLKMYVKSRPYHQIIPSFYYAVMKDLIKAKKIQGIAGGNQKLEEQFTRLLIELVSGDISKLERHEVRAVREMSRKYLGKEIAFRCKTEETVSTDFKSQVENSVEKLKENNKSDEKIVQEPPKEVPPQNNVSSRYEDCIRLYEQHNLDAAYDIILELKKQTTPNGLTTKQLEKLESISFEYEQMTRYYSNFDSIPWQFDKSENGVSLSFKMYEAEKQVAVLIESQLKIPIENFMAMLCQMDLFDKYVPFCYDTRQVKRISRNEALGHSKIYIPMLTDRETYFYAVGYNRIPKCGSLFFYSKTINEDKNYQKKYDFNVPPTSKLIRLQYNFFIVEYKPIGLDRAKIRIASSVDLKMNYLPNWIISISARKFAFNYFVNIIKAQKKFEKSPWAEKIRQRPQLYNFFKNKITEYIKPQL